MTHEKYQSISPREASPGDHIGLRLADGRLACTVEEVTQDG